MTEPNVQANVAFDRRDPDLKYSYFAASILAIVYTFNFLDRQFLSVLAQPVKVDLHLNDTEMGALTGLAFALFYTCFGIPVAALADRGHRVRIIAVACGLWSLFSAACGFANNFTSLALARIGVGVGEAGGSPPSYSIISDYSPRKSVAWDWPSIPGRPLWDHVRRGQRRLDRRPLRMAHGVFRSGILRRGDRALAALDSARTQTRAI